MRFELVGTQNLEGKMKIFILTFLFLLGCGTKNVDKRTGPKGDVGIDGKDGISCTLQQQENGTTVTCGDSQVFIPNGKDGIDGKDGQNGVDGKNFIPEPKQVWTGFYELEYGGYIELVELSDGRIQIFGTQRIYSKNFDQDLALHPNIPTGPHILKSSGNIFGEYTINYSSSTHDLEKDGTTSNITGNRKTIYNFYFKNSKLQIHFIVYDSDGHSIETNRVIREL